MKCYFKTSIVFKPESFILPSLVCVTRILKTFQCCLLTQRELVPSLYYVVCRLWTRNMLHCAAKYNRVCYWRDPERRRPPTGGVIGVHSTGWSSVRTPMHQAQKWVEPYQTDACWFEMLSQEIWTHPRISYLAAQRETDIVGVAKGIQDNCVSGPFKSIIYGNLREPWGLR